jgi:Fe-Mn family superoxide dismutase
LKETIDKQFTDFQGLKESFKKACLNRVLPGWVWLGITKDGQLVITQTNNEDNTLMHGIALVQCIPIIGIDLWEHAYIFTGDKESYFEQFWAHLDWGKISHHFATHNLN